MASPRSAVVRVQDNLLAQLPASIRVVITHRAQIPSLLQFLLPPIARFSTPHKLPPPPPPPPLAGKIALITGGSKGIGRAISQKLAALGAKIVINYASDSLPAETLVQELGPKNAIAVKADASSLDGIQHMVDETVDKWGKIDIVIASAGILFLNDLDKVTEEEFDRTFSLNVKGPLFLVQKCLPHISTGGRILLFSTTQCYASTITPNYTLYISSKGAIEQLVRGLSKDLASRGITINAIAPGPTATPLFLKGKSEEWLKKLEGLNPMGRIGRPEEVADMAAGLVIGGSWVSGQVLKVNGGMA